MLTLKNLNVTEDKLNRYTNTAGVLQFQYSAVPVFRILMILVCKLLPWFLYDQKYPLCVNDPVHHEPRAQHHT